MTKKLNRRRVEPTLNCDFLCRWAWFTPNLRGSFWIRTKRFRGPCGWCSPPLPKRPAPMEWFRHFTQRQLLFPRRTYGGIWNGRLRGAAQTNRQGVIRMRAMELEGRRAGAAAGARVRPISDRSKQKVAQSNGSAREPTCKSSENGRARDPFHHVSQRVRVLGRSMTRIRPTEEGSVSTRTVSGPWASRAVADRIDFIPAYAAPAEAKC